MESEKSKIWGIIPLLFVPILAVVVLAAALIALSANKGNDAFSVVAALCYYISPAWLVGISVIFHDAFSKNKSGLYYVLCPAITFALLLAYYLAIVFITIKTKTYNDRQLCLFFIVEALPCIPLYVLSYIKGKKTNTVLSNILGIAMIFLTPILLIPSWVIDFHIIEVSFSIRYIALLYAAVPFFGIALLYMIVSCIVVQIKQHQLREA